jgi:hypothetical protein
MVDSGDSLDTDMIKKKKEEAAELMKEAQKNGLIDSAEYLAAQEEVLRQTALEQFAKHKNV